MPLAEIPLFPLSNVVLFPDALTPLHVFEPRYRQLTEVALRTERMIGMVTVRPRHVGAMAGDPPLFEVGCAGFISQHQRLADGRFHIVLRGMHRFRILGEDPPAGDRLYRVARVEPLAEEIGDPARAAELRDRVLTLLQEVAERTLGDGAAAIDTARLAAMPVASFANSVSHAVALPPQEKQSLLEAPSAEERLARLEGVLSFHLALRAGSARGGSGTLH